MARGFLSEGSGRRESADQEPVTVDVILKRDLELSWGVMIPGQQRDQDMIWLPKSLVTLTGGEQPQCRAQCTMPLWMAEKKGLV